jgi:photosystem II stability/assembly factor-like uncharacterized protein
VPERVLNYYNINILHVNNYLNMKNTPYLIVLFILLSITGYSQRKKSSKKTETPQQAVDPELFSGLEYRSVGPTRGGRATAVAGVIQKPFEFYMGATGGGVWKTTDAGTSWSNIGDKEIAAGSIGAIAVAPSDYNTVYVGTGSACPRGNVSGGIGMYKSTDEGQSWQSIGLPKAGQIGKIEVHPTNPDLLYVAAVGNIFDSNPERGVYRSKDGGKNWQQVLFVSDSTGAVDLAMDPNNPRVIYAAMWRVQRKPWTLIDGGQEGGIWKTVDGGDTWEKLTGGLPTGLLGRIGLTVSPANSKRLWAQIQAKDEDDGGLYRSDDGGNSWEKINRHHKLKQRGWYYSHITADPQDENTIYASNTGFYRSVDGGKTFSERIRTPHGDNHGVWINPNNTQIMINCNDGGANVSLNGGDSWSSQLTYATSEFYRITVDNQFPFRLYAGQQDNSTISVPSASSSTLTPYEEWFSAGGGESGDVAVDPRNPDVIYASTYSGEITYLDRKKAYVRQLTAYPHYTEGTEQRDLKYRWQWNFPIAINQFNPDEVYQTSNYVHLSTDQGQTWKVISPDLTQAIDKYHGIPGGPIQHDGTGVEIYSTIFTFEISTTEEGLFWAGSDDGLIHISRDKGATWQNVTPKNMPLEGTVNKISISKHAPGRAFAAVYKYRDGDFKPYIFRTDDYGSTWNLLTNGSNGIPDNHFVRVIIEDNMVKGLLYAGTEFGAYVSFNDGQSWQSLQQNLPVVPITDMEIQDNSLALSTQGRSFWIMDDLAPLREAVGQSVTNNILYSPRTAYYTNLQGKNVNVNFYIASEIDSTNKAKVEILDASGKVIRTYLSDADEDKDEHKLKVKKGYNSLNWNMRLDGPELVDDFVSMVLRNPAPGPSVPPAEYVVRLTVNDSQQEKPLHIKLDPRWTHITNADYQLQYDMGVDIANLIEESHNAIENIRAIRTQANGIAKRATKVGYNEELAKSAKALDKKLTEVEDMIIQNKVETSQDAINYPRKFSNHVGRVYSILVYDDGKPTGGVIERYEDVKKEYDTIRTQLQGVMTNEFVAFNELLEKENVDHIIVPNK